MPIDASPAGTLDIENATLRSREIVALTNMVAGNDVVRSGGPALEVYGDPSHGGNEARLELVSNTANTISTSFTSLTSNAGVFSVETGTDASDNGTITFGGFSNERLRITSDGNVGVGTDDPLERLDVRGAIIAPVVSYGLNQDAPYLIAGTAGYTGATTNWDTHGFQHRMKSDSLGNPRITVDGADGELFSIHNNGRVGIGTDNPTSSLHINGSTMQIYQTKEWNYEWTGNNVRRFTIPVTGQSARGSYTVECEANGVAQNGSGDRKATFKGYINNYGPGTFGSRIEESLNAEAFYVSHIGSGNDAGGTLRIDYRPEVGYQQNVTTTLFIKTRWAAATTGFGDLSAQDMGSNYTLTAPAFTSRELNLSRNVGFGASALRSYSGTNTKSQLAAKYITGLPAGSGSIYLYADYNGFDRTGSRVYTYTVTKNVTGGNAITDLDQHSSSISSTTNFNPYISFYSNAGSAVSMYLRVTGDRSGSNNVYWKIGIITTS